MIRAVFLLLAFCLPRSLPGQMAHQCAPVSGSRILGRDLALAAPEFSALSPEMEVGFSPTPGVERVFSIAELQRLARRSGIETRITSPVCFAWALHPLSRQEILEALRKSLAGHEVEMEVTDQCRTPVPEGEIVFPMEGLSAESRDSTLWNGYVSYGGGKIFSTWAKVRVTVNEPQIVAVRALHAGELIGAADIRTVVYRGPLRHDAVLHEEREVTGMLAIRPIETGTVLAKAMLALPRDVESQQTVTVHIQCGAARIETQGIALNAGYRGDVIKVKNPKTGRVFRAQINERGMVTVVPGGDVGLVVEEKKS